MTIHQHFASDLLATGASNLQDAYRIAWMRGIPSHLRRQRETKAAVVSRQHVLEGSRRGASTMAEKHRLQRDRIAPQVLEMHRTGATQTDIARQVGVGRWVIARIIEEASA